MGAFADAIEFIKKNGWHKGSIRDPETGAVCAIGAFMYNEDAFECSDYDSILLLDEIAREQYPDRIKDRHVCGLHEIAQVNDHPETTIEDIFALFEKAEVRSQEIVDD